MLWMCGAAPTARAQEAHYSLAFRGVPLDQAIERFVDATNVAVSYDPRLVEGRQTYCVAQDRPPEAILECLLAESGLDYYRLSSGTYVLTAPAEAHPQHGYLSGTVTDRETSSPLADAHVYLANAGRGTTTNRAGQFVFPSLLPGQYAVRVTHVGYRTWTDTLRVRPDDRTHTEATLRTEPIFITPVVVDGMQEQSAAASPERNEIESSNRPVGRAAGPAAAYRGLNTLSGVRLNNVTADAHLQGGRAGDHQLRLDGVPVYLPRTTLGLIGPFSAFALDRVTVKKAGFDATQGSQLSGLILAEHALTSKNGGDLQIDPLSVNGRVQWAPVRSGSKEIATMAAARFGLWNVYEPPRLHGVLEHWSAPDPFLLRASTDSSLTDFPASDLGSTDPTAHFSDLHGAARIRLDPLHTVHVSAYRGERTLAGGTLPGSQQTTGDASQSALFTTTDDYRWTNALGQIRYNAVLGNRTLLNAQLRGTRYELAHGYELLDSLHTRRIDEQIYTDYRSTIPAQDGNSVRTATLEGALDHARGRHHIRLGAEASWTTSSFALYGAHFPGTDASFLLASAFDGLADSPPHTVGHEAERGRITAFASDEWSMTDRFQTELGVRLTYLPDRATVYAEPRMALRLDQPNGSLGSWSMRTAAGLYRQFTHQTDVSVLNAGSLLPSMRVWLPLDASVRPPHTYHLAHEMVARPTSSLRLRMEGYAKFQPHRLAMRYAPVTESSTPRSVISQNQFLADATGRTIGGSMSAEWSGSWARLQARYEYSHATQQSDALFDGQRVPTPWNEPHRIELGADWMPTDHLTVSARGHSVWGRSWGFRQVYYDYFGHSDQTRHHGGFDFGHPDAHILPPLYRLDVSLAYTQPLGSTSLQARVDVRNVTDHHNVADWRLVRDDDGTWQRTARHLYPRMPSVALRVHF